MTMHQDAVISKMRLLKAVAFVLAVLLVIPGIDALVRVMGPPARGPAYAAGIDAGELVGVPDAFTALDKIEDLAESHDDALPASFDSEIGVLPYARDVRVSVDGSVVGYAVEGDADEALASISAQLSGRGWNVVPLQGANGATFVKREGAYSWALATCTQVGTVTSVVVRT